MSSLSPARLRAPLLTVLVLAVSAGLVVLEPGTASATTTPDGHASGDVLITQTFGYTGAPQDWTVPDGVTSVQVTARGAAGGAGESPTKQQGDSTVATSGGAGGSGGQVQARIPTTGGQLLTFAVGSVGAVRGGGYNGGGNGGLSAMYDQRCGSETSTLYPPCRGGGGGGATDVRSGGTDLNDRVLVAAGGGGGGGGFSGYYSAPGAGAGAADGSGTAGTTPGRGGDGAKGLYGYDTYPPTYGRGGGGGGGGYLGGAGAPEVPAGDAPQGGSGGTDYVDPSFTQTSIASAANGGDGSVRLVYTAPSELQLDLSSPHLRADGTDSIIATVDLAAGGVAMPGQTATISADHGIAVSAVTDHGDGSYTATLTGAGLSTTVGDATVSASIGSLTGTRTLDVQSGPPAYVVLTTDHGVLAPSDTAGATLTASVVDSAYHAVRGATVSLTGPDGTPTTMTDAGDGTYTAHVDARAADTTYTATTGDVTGSVTVGAHPGAGTATVTRTFVAVGAKQTWTVPVGVTSATVVARGARGGKGQDDPYGYSYGNAGEGGSAAGTIPVSGGRDLVVMVGGVGGDKATQPADFRNNGGFNGGGSGCPPFACFYTQYNAAGGGGASDVRLDDGLTGRLVVAGGGGGVGGPTYFNIGGCPGGQGPFSTTPGQGNSNTNQSFQSANAGSGGGYFGGANCSYSTGGGGGSNFALDSGPLAATATSTTTGGNAGAGSVTISYAQPGTLSAASPTTRVRADGTSTVPVTATLVDGAGDPIVGATMTASVDHGAKASAVVDNGDGTYTTTITSSTALADLTVRFSTGSLAATAVVHERPAKASLQLSSPTVVGDGTSTVVATATFADGDDAGTAGDEVDIDVAGGHTTVGPVTDHGDGTYTATITSTTQLGTDTVTSSNGDLSATASLQVVHGPLASFTFSDLGPVTAGTPSTVTVTAHDAYGHVATSYAGTPSLTEDLEGAPTGCGTKASDGCAHTATLGSFTNGVATLSMTAYRTTGAAHVSIADGDVTGTLTPFAVAPGSAHHLAVTGPTAPLKVGRAGAVTISARDRYDNPATSWTGTLALSSSDPAATFPAAPVVGAGDGGSTTVPVTLGSSGTQTLTASATGLGSGTATLAGVLPPSITSPDVVTFRGGDAGQSFVITTTPGFPGTTQVSLSGELPRGISAEEDDAAGTITLEGTPDVADAGQWPVTVVASNDAGTTVQHLVVTVTTPPQLSGTAPKAAKIGRRVGFTASATGSPAPVVSVQGRPAWLQVTRLSRGELRFSGRPQRRGTYAVRVVATSAGGSTTRTWTIRVTR